MSAPDEAVRRDFDYWLQRAYETKTGRVLLAPVWAYEHVRDWAALRKFTIPFWYVVGFVAPAIYFEVRKFKVGQAWDGRMLATYEIPLSWMQDYAGWFYGLFLWITMRPGMAVLSFMVILPLVCAKSVHIARNLFIRPRSTRAQWINRHYDGERNELQISGPEPADANMFWDRSLFAVAGPLLMLHEAVWRWRLIWGPWKDPVNEQPPRLILRLGLLRGELIARWAFPGPTPERRAQYAAWLEPFELVMFDTWMHVRETDPQGRAAKRDWWWRNGIYKEWQPNGAYVPASVTTVEEDFDGGVLTTYADDEAPTSTAGGVGYATVATWTADDEDQGERVSADELRQIAMRIVENYQDEGPEGDPLNIDDLSESQVVPLRLIIGPAFIPHREIPLSLGELGPIVFEPLPSMQQEIIGDSPETWRVLIPVDVLETSDEPEWLIAARSSGAWVIEVDGLGGDGMAAVKISPTS